MMDFNHIFLGLFLWAGLMAFIASLFNNQSQKIPQTQELEEQTKQIDELKQQCWRLKQELELQSKQKEWDLQNVTFEQLQTLLTNYPTACQMAEANPDLPAKNLIPLFTPLENLLNSWGYEPINQPGEQVNYNPELHQSDGDDFTEGELVYVSFIGYRKGDKILLPAKVSRTLPVSFSFEE